MLFAEKWLLLKGQGPIFVPQFAVFSAAADAALKQNSHPRLLLSVTF
jgi:hypothetical protein